MSFDLGLDLVGFWDGVYNDGRRSWAWESKICEGCYLLHIVSVRMFVASCLVPCSLM